ncbi:TPA: iron chelate uptake ABC transporter family permease subunit [Escherichia coli]|nr:iron chelate uptake ABC transporter family permease subunit [Escherichia coli]
MIYVSRRLLITCLLLVSACVVAGIWGLRSGAVTLEISQVFAALMGDAPRSMTMVVTEWRLPRVLMALLIGAALGVSVERSRLLMMLVAVVLTAAATALAGPISFIALVAPHIARRISGTARWGLTQAALCGALLLLAADLCAQQLFMPYQLPVGVVTVSLGGIYLIVLLIQESRKK